jgi:hypothetical protein
MANLIRCVRAALPRVSTVGVACCRWIWQCPTVLSELPAMNRTRRTAFVIAAALPFAGCSRSQTTALDPSTGRARVYAMTADEALTLAHGAILRSFPGRRVTPIEGPVRGFSTYTRVVLDTFTQQVLVRPVIGATPDGRAVEGYSFEVSGSGTSGSGAWRNDAFFQALQRDLDASGKGVEVVSMRARLEVAAPAAAGGAAAAAGPDPVDQLRRLRTLRDEGVISAQEYERARAALLRRI